MHFSAIPFVHVTVDRVRKFLGFVAAALPTIAGIGAAIAYSRTRQKPLGDGSTHRHGPPRNNRRDPFAFEPTDENEDDPWRPTRDEPDYDGGCLILGRKHHKFGDPYRVCLTGTQEQKLFRGKASRQKKLGCGVFACAYTSPAKTRVVKFTRDAQDVAALLEAQKTGVVAKVYAVYKLARPGRTIPTRDPFTMRVSDARDVPVYALVVERLRTVPSDEREAVDDELLAIRDQVVDQGMSPNDFCDAQRDEDGNTGCGDVQVAALRIYEKLKAAGISWNDMHAGNIGYDKNGRMKVLDLGLTDTELKHEPEILEGAQRRLGHLRLV